MAASIDSQALPRARTDWRREGVALVDAWRRHELPAEVRTGALALMDALGLNCGAFDLIVTPDGRHVFLEVNPCGEFMWLLLAAALAGLPIDEALAAVLCDRAFRRVRAKEPVQGSNSSGRCAMLGRRRGAWGSRVATKQRRRSSGRSSARRRWWPTAGAQGPGTRCTSCRRGRGGRSS